MKKEIIRWWEGRRLRFNVFAFLSGLLCIIILYLLSYSLRRPVYFFFMIPSGVLYLLFLNIMYLAGWLFYEYFNVKNLGITKDVFYKLLIGAAVLMNLGMLLLCILDFII